MGLKPTKIYIKSLDTELNLRELSYKGAMTVAQALNPVDRAVATVVNSLCDDEGKLIFSNDDVETLADTFSFSVIQEIAYEVSNLTKVSPSDTVK